MAGTTNKGVRQASHTKAVSAQIIRSSRQLLRHTVATLAYRAEKVLREPPEGFAGFRASDASRTPLEILSHLGDLLAWAERLARGQYRWEPEPEHDWDAAARRFFRHLRRLDRALASPPPKAYGADTIFQGPIADALTHVGQLSLLRGMFAVPVRPEAYARAAIRIGRVGPGQPNEAHRVRRRRQPPAAEVRKIGRATGMARAAKRERNAGSQAGCRGPRRFKRDRNGASGEARAECREPGGVQGAPPIQTRPEWRERRSASGMQGARRGAGGPADSNATGMARAAKRERNAGSQAGCRGPRRFKIGAEERI